MEYSTAGSFLLLQGELRKQARGFVMLFSLQGGEEMSCSTAKDDHLRAKQGPPSGSHSDMQAAKVPTNELGCADEDESRYSGDDAAPFVQLWGFFSQPEVRREAERTMSIHCSSQSKRLERL